MNGSYYKTIATSTQNDGEYIWTVSSSVAAGSDYTVRVRSVDNTSIKDFSDATFTVVPQGQALSVEGNDPNPFNPETTIRYVLPNATHVKVVIYNMLGQQIAQLVNQTQNAGRHAVRFDATHLASGFYFYQIQANNQIITNKMMLIK